VLVAAEATPAPVARVAAVTSEPTVIAALREIGFTGSSSDGVVLTSSTLGGNRQGMAALVYGFGKAGQRATGSRGSWGTVSSGVR
jgi:hypothetical protein